MTEPIIGDFAVVKTSGIVASFIRWGTNSSVNHAFVYIGGGQIVEAQPGGAIISPVSNYPDAIWANGNFIPSPATGQRIADEAVKLVGTPYDWRDIFAIALAQRRLGGHLDPTKSFDQQPWYIKRIMNDKYLICSELCDAAYLHAGVHLFKDNRVEGLCSPGNLLELIEVTSS